MRVLHQNDGVSDSPGTTQHRNSKRSNGDVIGIGFNLFVFKFHRSIPCLKHIKTNLKDDYSTGNTETIGRDTEEFEKELPGKDKHHQRYKRHDGGTAHNSLPLLICHSVCHGQKDRHCPQRIGQRKERSKTK